MNTARACDLADPDCFPVDLDVRNAVFRCVQVDAASLRAAAFLDTRWDAAAREGTQVGIGEVLARGASTAPPAWLWHTSFCGSTLLARALDVPDRTRSLREPLVLRRLSDAVADGGMIGPALVASHALLARRPPGIRVVVKPTHAALNIAADLLSLDRRQRAVLLTSSLHEFMVSNLKKPDETQQRAMLLAQRALAATGLHRRLPAQALAPPDRLCLFALQWVAQRQLVHDIVARCGSQLMLIDAEAMYADLRGTVATCAAWLDLDVPAALLDASVAAIAGVHAKSPAHAYSPAHRREEGEVVRADFADGIASATNWAEAWLLPSLREQPAP